MLFFRRTTTIGAIVGLVVAGNIMAINYCFDVPVKIVSTALVAMCILLLIKDGQRLINFFILNKPAPPANLTPPRFNKKWKNIIAVTLKYLVIAYVLIGFLIGDIQTSKLYGDVAKKPPFYGIYDVKEVIFNKDTVPPLATHDYRWNKLVIDRYGASVHMMNNNIDYYDFKADTVAHSFTFTKGTNKFVLNYTGTKANLQLKGEFDYRQVQIRVSEYDLKDFILINRGFHWINEYPLNQ